MVRMSRTRGTRCSTTRSSVRRAAASAGSAEFFEPLVGISPCSAAPPVITNLSMWSSECFLFGERLRHAPASRLQTPFRFFARYAGLAHNDGCAHAVSALRQQFASALVG